MCDDGEIINKYLETEYVLKIFFPLLDLNSYNFHSITNSTFTSPTCNYRGKISYQIPTSHHFSNVRCNGEISLQNMFTTVGAYAWNIVGNICRRSMWKCGLRFSGYLRSSIYQLSMKLLKSTSACRHELIHHSYISDTHNSAQLDIYTGVFF